MNIKVIGHLDKNYIENTFNKTKRLIKIPRNLHIYFLENINLCYSIKLPRNIQKRLKIACSHKISFSFKYKNRGVIIIYMDKVLAKKEDSLIGLLLHEISHINQINKGVYKKVLEDFENIMGRNHQLFMKLKYEKRDLEWLFNDISTISILTLKDIYANNELVKNKLTKYLITYYKLEFDRKICPRPVFYGDLKKSAQYDLDLIRLVFEFELSLISVILPLYKTKRAHELVRYLSKCYESNINKVSKKCHELIILYFRDFKKKNFNKEFFNAVFRKVYSVLK
ncbi:hypothetical protein J4449_04790 [Candidatus Woesearchaeota archaeon]|nr:hypothetical protein [Candidatus Woesearchaeota archaeon]